MIVIATVIGGIARSALASRAAYAYDAGESGAGDADDGGSASPDARSSDHVTALQVKFDNRPVQIADLRERFSVNPGSHVVTMRMTATLRAVHGSPRFWLYLRLVRDVFVRDARARKLARVTTSPSPASSRTSPRAELAQFLRTRRARVHPADVGLPEGARRRTPGLRREEVALLAEVGASWYTWLEQGRDIHVSEPLLERLARALRLTSTERAHLFALAHGRPAARPVIAPTDVSSTLRRVVDAYPFPALVSTPRRDILAWNEPATLLYGDFSTRPIEERNGLWSMFMNAERRARIPDWEKAARGSVAGFRLDAALAADRAEFDALAKTLSEKSPEFARFWGDHDVNAIAEGVKGHLHPELGLIEFDHVTLAHSEPDGRALRVSYYSPLPGKSMARALKLFRTR